MVKSERDEAVLEAFVEKGEYVGLVVLGHAQDHGSIERHLDVEGEVK